jgi:hypothetical protein
MYAAFLNAEGNQMEGGGTPGLIQSIRMRTSIRRMVNGKPKAGLRSILSYLLASMAHRLIVSGLVGDCQLKPSGSTLLGERMTALILGGPKYQPVI